MEAGGLVGEVALAFGPFVDLVEEFVERLAAVVAGQRFMQVPPNAFDGICFRRILRQIMQLDAISPTLQILLRLAAIVEPSVVADDMNHPIASQAATQVVQMSDE